MTVLVTGATAGFGRAVTPRFAAAGHKVVAAGRRLDRLQSLVTELGERQAHALHLDVRDRQAVERGFESGYSAEEVQAAQRFITQPNLDQLRGDADAACDELASFCPESAARAWQRSLELHDRACKT